MESIITRNIVEIVSKGSFSDRIKSGKKLRIKYGVDPSSPDIHLGHAVVLWQLKKFQDAGHTVIFLIGDYTAMIGDPSGKNKTRPVLTEKQVSENAKTYLNQVGNVLDIDKVKICRNSEWFGKMNIQDIIQLASHFSVAQIIERDDFDKRLKGGVEISFHELLYPIMQAYDSVMLESDVEIGGTDQKFNMLAGRELQKKIGQIPQDVIMLELLVGLDGKNKMSKSLNNYIGITETAEQQFGKIMSINDQMIIKYFNMCTLENDKNISEYKKELVGGTNPRDIKEKLAVSTVQLYHGKKAAEEARDKFISQFRNKEIPLNIPEVAIEGTYDMLLLVNNIGFGESNAEVKRLISQGAMKIDGTKITDYTATVTVKSGMIVQIGKRNYWRIK